jgi:hypothetical protein
MKISVAMCTYNGARFLREQLDSIAAQARPPDELVICDDASTDATSEIVRDFATSTLFPVRLHANDGILGSTKNFEKAIKLCSGDVIALSDQDDVWRSDKLALIEKCFSEDPDIGMVFSDAEIVDEQLRTLGRRVWNESGFNKEKQRLIREGKAFEVLLPAWWVTGATMAFQAKFKDLVLPIPTNLPMIHDGWISLVIAAVAKITFIAEPLILYRQHDRQQLGAPARRSDEVENAKTRLLARLMGLSRHNSYLDLVKSLNAIHERLALEGKAVKGIRAIEDQLKHLNARSHLPDQALSRLTLVLKELLTRRYHKYSNGISSAVKDLVYPPADHNPTGDTPQ